MIASHPCYDPVLPGEEARKYLGISHLETLRRLVRSGDIAAIRSGGIRSTMRFRLSELNRYLSTIEKPTRREAPQAARQDVAQGGTVTPD